MPELDAIAEATRGEQAAVEVVLHMGRTHPELVARRHRRYRRTQAVQVIGQLAEVTLGQSVRLYYSFTLLLVAYFYIEFSKNSSNYNYIYIKVLGTLEAKLEFAEVERRRVVLGGGR